VNRRLSVAVVICTTSHEREPLLRACVDSVLAGTRVPEELVVVVDQNPVLRAKLAESLPAAVTLLQTERRGLSEGRTVGIEAVTADVVAFTDDDIIVERDWLASLVRPFDDTAQVLGVAGTIVPRADTHSPWLPKELLWLVGCTYPGYGSEAAPVRNPFGGNMAFRRRELIAIGRFASAFGRRGNALAACEETELSLRLERAYGLGRIRYASAARVHHFVPAKALSPRPLFRRCVVEGLSKGRLHRLHGVSALRSERRYAQGLLVHALPRLVVSAVRDRELRALQRACALLAALVVTGGAFLVGLASGPRPTRPPQSHGRDGP
jgi:cellulose synthase/poly-beta-1,6-N-acetylglucosamine synthase-like glycosyltransferase